MEGTGSWRTHKLDKGRLDTGTLHKEWISMSTGAGPGETREKSIALIVITLVVARSIVRLPVSVSPVPRGRRAKVLCRVKTSRVSVSG